MVWYFLLVSWWTLMVWSFLFLSHFNTPCLKNFTSHNMIIMDLNSLSPYLTWSCFLFPFWCQFVVAGYTINALLIICNLTQNYSCAWWFHINNQPLPPFKICLLAIKKKGSYLAISPHWLLTSYCSCIPLEGSGVYVSERIFMVWDLFLVVFKITNMPENIDVLFSQIFFWIIINE